MFQKNNLKIINADCMDIMKNYEDNYFDLAIVDPPYGIGADVKQNNAALSRIKAKGKSKSGRGWKLYESTNWDNEIPDENYFKELKRVSKNQIIWGGNYFTKFLNPSMGWLVWNKMQREFSLADGELAWTSYNKAIRIFDYSRGAALSNNNNNGGRFHPTQKPVKLYEWILKNYGDKDFKILDTHLGSASSAIAAFYYGCKEFVGIELDKDYYNSSIKRIKKHTIQTKLF
tara:strand:+ start:266 stop:955 length:690 start_codon:yes stop_codon:yes gene_type:complete